MSYKVETTPTPALLSQQSVREVYRFEFSCCSVQSREAHYTMLLAAILTPLRLKEGIAWMRGSTSVVSVTANIHNRNPN